VPVAIDMPCASSLSRRTGKEQENSFSSGAQKIWTVYAFISIEGALDNCAGGSTPSSQVTAVCNRPLGTEARVCDSSGCSHDVVSKDNERASGSKGLRNEPVTTGWTCGLRLWEG
jgi:hypothetical protein